MFKKILFGDDLSARALPVMRVAVDLARRYRAELVVLNVREDFMSSEEMVLLRVDVSNFQHDMEKKAKAIKEKVRADLESFQASDLPCEVLLREGKPHREIVATAAEIGADLIVIGTHGISTLREKLLSATSLEVVQHAGRSVLAVWTEA